MNMSFLCFSQFDRRVSFRMTPKRKAFHMSLWTFISQIDIWSALVVLWTYLWNGKQRQSKSCHTRQRDKSPKHKSSKKEKEKKSEGMYTCSAVFLHGRQRIFSASNCRQEQPFVGRITRWSLIFINQTALFVFPVNNVYFESLTRVFYL